MAHDVIRLMQALFPCAEAEPETCWRPAADVYQLRHGWLVKLDLAPTSEPTHSKASADRLISGDPSFKTWAQDESRNSTVHTGVWEATPGETRSIKGEAMEFCYILSGVVELTEEGQPPRTFRAGDSFVMKPGYNGVWKTIETIRKIYVVVG